MGFNPANTKWSVAGMDNNGKIGDFHPTPWEFNQESMNGGSLWAGGYREIPNTSGSYSCQILMANSTDPGASFEVHFVTSDRFIGTQNGQMFRFGKKL